MAGSGGIDRIEHMAVSASDGLRTTLGRLSNLTAVVALIVAVIGVATFATGMWVFDGSTGWIVLGGVLCAVPVVAALVALVLVRGAAKAAPRLLDDAREFFTSSRSAASTVLIDHDSGVALGMQAKSFGGLRRELLDRRKELPALFAGVRAITSVPGLAAVAVLGSVGIGALGTILLIGGLID